MTASAQHRTALGVLDTHRRQHGVRHPETFRDELFDLDMFEPVLSASEYDVLWEAIWQKWHGPRIALRLAKPEDVPDFASRTQAQVVRARALIHEDFSRCVHLPWPSLHQVIGHGILPYQLWAIAAASGHGKTTVAMNVVKALVEVGKRVYVVPLEQPTDVMRVYLAALSLGFNTRYALANRWRDLPPSAQGAIESELVRQEDEAELLHFSDVDFLTVRGVPAVLREAEAFGADLIVIDHIHQIQSEGQHPHAAFTALCQTLQNFTKNRRIPILAMAQLHRGTGPKDRVRPYLPPDVDSVQMGKILEQVAAVVMGWFRPLRRDVTKAEFQRIRLGAPIREFLKPATTAAAVLKSRIGGDIGDIVELTYDRGQIREEHRLEVSDG